MSGGLLGTARQVVEEARELDPAGHLAVHDLGANAPTAHQQALVDEFLDGPANGGAAESEALAERHLVLQS